MRLFYPICKPTVGLVMRGAFFMKKIKPSGDRKNEILDVADELFNKQGFDNTSIRNILEKVGIARGTLYHHFDSKEEIMDALIERYNKTALSAAKQVADNKNLPVLERLLQTFMAMNVSKDNDTSILDHVHKPQNALLHQKMHKSMLEGIPPILLGIVEDGIAEGLFDTPYPYESLEMIVVYINTVLDDNSESLTQEDYLTKMSALIYNIETLLKAKPGSLQSAVSLFDVS